MTDGEKIIVLREALQHFVDRVEAGAIRSKANYEKFKKILIETKP